MNSSSKTVTLFDLIKRHLPPGYPADNDSIVIGQLPNYSDCLRFKIAGLEEPVLVSAMELCANEVGADEAMRYRQVWR